jgi:uncharacterized protein Yka (UPF0111/DUF47 family)
MFSIQRLLGREGMFFDLLEGSAREALVSVQLLSKYLKSPKQLEALDEFIATRRKDKAINTQITEAICTHFITALEKEDIEALSSALYRIPKTVEKIAERLLLAPQGLQGHDFSSQGTLLDQAAALVLTMIQNLRKGISLPQIQSYNERLQGIEGEADKVLVRLLREVYSGRYDGVEALFLKDVYELLERVVDRCRDAGNVITHIVLKNA